MCYVFNKTRLYVRFNNMAKTVTFAHFVLGETSSFSTACSYYFKHAVDRLSLLLGAKKFQENLMVESIKLRSLSLFFFFRSNPGLLATGCN